MLRQRACSSSREFLIALLQSTDLGTGGLKGRNSFLVVQYFGFQEMHASEPAPPDLEFVYHWRAMTVLFVKLARQSKKIKTASNCCQKSHCMQHTTPNLSTACCVPALGY